MRTVAEAKWYPAFGGVICLECHLDRGSGVTVDDFRGWVARCLLGDEGRYWLPQALAVRLCGWPVLWAEHTPRPPVREGDAPLVERFSFVDVARIVEALAPPPPDYRRGAACEGCGVADRWLYRPGGLEARRVSAAQMVNLEVPASEACANCGHRRGLDGAPLRAELPRPALDPGTAQQLAAFHAS